jgi:hypothetical protein
MRVATSIWRPALAVRGAARNGVTGAGPACAGTSPAGGQRGGRSATRSARRRRAGARRCSTSARPRCRARCARATVHGETTGAPRPRWPPPSACTHARTHARALVWQVAGVDAACLCLSLSFSRSLARSFSTGLERRKGARQESELASLEQQRLGQEETEAQLTARAAELEQRAAALAVEEQLVSEAKAALCDSISSPHRRRRHHHHHRSPRARRAARVLADNHCLVPSTQPGAYRCRRRGGIVEQAGDGMAAEAHASGWMMPMDSPRVSPG